MEECSRLSTTPIHLRFYGEFEVCASLKSVDSFSSRQLVLLEAILASPSLTAHLARLAVETDLNAFTDKHFRDKFRGPSNLDLLDAVLSSLPEEERSHWGSLRNAPGDLLHNEITPVFFAFEVRLKKTGIEEIAT